MKSFYSKLAVGALLLGMLAPAAAFAALAPAPSPCATVGTPFLTITQPITEPDSGTSGDWANDTFTENAQVWLGTDGTTFCGSGSTTNGTFVTTGPKSPEAGAPLASGISGTFTGGETWIFPAGTATTTASSSVTLSADNSATDSQFSNWQSQVLTQTAGASTYAFTYVTPNNGSWTNADATSGGDQGDIKDTPPIENTRTTTGYSSIQAAIDAAQPGDTIAVAAGTYDSFSIVGKTGITITGAGKGSTVINPTTLVDTGVGHKYTTDVHATVFVNNSTNVTLQGMTIDSNNQTPGELP